MLFRQFVDEDLGCGSYLIGDEAAGVAAVVDPAYAIEQYVDEAERCGVRIVRVLETHTHADHISGHGRLALEHGVAVSAHPAAEPQHPFDPIVEGDEVELGSVRVRVLHTPGHRPEHCAFEVIDTTQSHEPWGVLTGDSLFVGDAARPDLAVAAVEGARDLRASLQRLLGLPEGVGVYPGHVAGSLCGAGMSSEPSSTIGSQRRDNRASAVLADPDEFIAHAIRGSSPRPANMDRIVALNRGPFVAGPPPLREVREAGEATILDVRSAREFAAGHAPGALNVPVGESGFATKAGFVLEPDEQVVIDAASAKDAQRAARGLRAVGLMHLAGYRVAPPASEQLVPLDLDELERLVARGEVAVVDVREPSERDAGYIPESRNIPYRILRASAASLRGTGPIATICESGARAGIAASILAAAGIDARPVLESGVPDWRARGNRTVEFRRCGS